MPLLDLKPGDVLLYHGTTRIGRFIAWWTASIYCHAAMIGPAGTVLEMYDLSGGRESTIEEHAGYVIDVYRHENSDKAFGPRS